VQPVDDLGARAEFLLVAELIEYLAEKFLGVPARVGQQGDLGLGGVEFLDQRASSGSYRNPNPR
jgi:hypothetical protein